MSDISGLPGFVKPVEADFGIRFNVWPFVSPFLGTTRTLGMPGARWLMALRFNSMTDLRSGELEAVLTQLEGGANRLVLYRYGRPALRGVGGGSPVVNGSNQVGSTVNVSGLPNNLSNWAITGDMLGIGGELKMVTAPVNSNGSGQATINFKPAFRVSPLTGSAIVTSRPTARFILTDPSVSWTHMRAKIVSGHAIELLETWAIP